MSAQKMKLEICGSSYVISSGDSEDYLLGLAERLDKDMNQVMISSPNASVTAAAVITALSYLDESSKNAFGADNMRAQIQGYLEDASRARLTAEELKREVSRLKNELAFYERQQKPRAAEPQAQPLLNVPAPERAVPAAEKAAEDQMGLEDL